MEARSSSGGSGIDGIAFLINEAGESYALRGLYRSRSVSFDLDSWEGLMI